MKKLAKFIPLITVPFLLTSCGALLKAILNPSGRTSSEQTTSQSTSQKPNSSSNNTSTNSGSSSKDQSWTIMLYVCGSNLESEDYSGTEYAGYGYNNGNIAGYASMDIDEILEVKNKPDNVNIILETGGATKWAKSEIKTTELGRWHVANNKLVKDESVTKANMGLRTTFQSFLEWGFENYPADKYGVFMWNHGGAMTGCCFDENYDDDGLTADEIDTALTNARANKKVSNKLEFIAYDACLMAIQDIMEINSHHFNYMVASQESEYAGGYDYDAWLPALYKDTSLNGGDICTEIASTFMDEQNATAKEYNDYYGYKKGDDEYWPYDQTQAVYDLSKAADYKTAFEALAKEISSSGMSGTNFKNGVNAAKKYGYDDYYSSYNNGYAFNVFDVETALDGLVKKQSSLSTKANAVMTELNKLVIYEEHGKDTEGCGLNLYCPIASVDSKSVIKSQTNFTEWYSLITKSGYGNWAY